MSATFRSFGIYNFRVWFVGAFLSNIGTWMQTTAQSWVVLTELTHHDATAVGITMAFQFAPPLFLVGVSGWIADRFDRRRTLFITQSAQGLLALFLGLLLLYGNPQLWEVYLFAALLGCATAVDTPTRQSFVTDLVNKENMSNAVALNAASFNSARLIGPAVAGVLIMFTQSGWVFIINAVSFIAMIVALLVLKTDQIYHASRSTIRVTMMEGFRYLGKRSDLLTVIVIVFLVGAFAMNFPIFGSTMAIEFGRGSSGYGLLTSILGLGSLLGALLSARRSKARIRYVILGGGSIAVVALGLAVSPNFFVFGIASALLGLTITTMLTTANGFIQSTTDPHVRGRMMAIYQAVLMGSTLVGAPIVGFVATTFGARWSLGVASLAGLVALVIGLTWYISSRNGKLAVETGGERE